VMLPPRHEYARELTFLSAAPWNVTNARENR
jgi:hypothetical protein